MNEDTRKALELAREALENFWLNSPTMQSKLAKASQAIAAIDAALSAPASPVATSGSVLVPAEPTPEMAKAGCFRYCNAFVRDYKAMLAAAPVAQGEPVAEVAGRSGGLYIIFLPAGRNLGLGDKLYAAPQPVREVQPLTDEQAKEVMRALNDSLTGVKGWGWIDVIRAVERAHGITKGEA